MRNSKCVENGGCPTDYVATGLSCITSVLVAIAVCFVIVNRISLERNFNKKVSLLVVQAAASLMFLWGAVMSNFVLGVNRQHRFYCLLWQVWLEGPFGFGLLFSCFIAQAYRLCYVFYSRRLQPLTYYQLLFLLLLPWLIVAAVLQSLPHSQVFSGKTCSYHHLHWRIVIVCLHALYPILLVCSFWKIRNISFQFNEFNELLKGTIVCSIFLVTLAGLFVAKKFSSGSALVITYRFILILAVNASILVLYWIAVSKPVCDLVRSRADKSRDFSTMGQALGVPYSGYVAASSLSFDFSKPLECLLEHKRFRQSYLEFADSRMAGEIVHFYVEVRELNKISTDNPVQRVYLAEHIIEKYIKTGSPTEINISHQMRSEILSTRDLADPNLFRRAVNEALKMMQTNLTNEYWKSTCFDELKSELETHSQYDGLDLMEATRIDIAPDNPFEPGCSDLHKAKWADRG